MTVRPHRWRVRATRSVARPSAVRRCVVAVLVTLLSAGCGDPGRDTTADQFGSGDGAASDPSRRTSTLDSGAGLRVVALVPSITEIVIALGATEHLVARTDYDSDAATAELPSVGGGLAPNLEALVGLETDVVLMTAAREAPAMQQRLNALGIEMLLLPTNTIADVYAAIEELGALLAREAQARKLAESLRTELSVLASSLADLEPVDVMYVVWSDPPMTSGSGTFVDELIEVAGGRNVFDDAPLACPTVGFETILERDPDVLIWSSGGDDPETLDRLRELPGWRDVPAMKEGRVVFVDGTTFNRPGPGLVTSARTLAHALHPEAF